MAEWPHVYDQYVKQSMHLACGKLPFGDNFTQFFCFVLVTVYFVWRKYILSISAIDVMLYFSKPVPFKEQTHGWPEGEYILIKFSFLGELFL